MEKTQWFRKERIERIQLFNLRRLLNHAYQNVPYYHRTFKRVNLRPHDVKSVEDLNKLPILRRTQVATLSKDLMPRNLPGKVYQCETSGTTSVPMQFYRSHDDYSWGSAAALRAFRWAGFKIGHKHAAIYGIRQNKLNRISFKIRNLLARRLVISVFKFSQDSMGLISSELRRYDPSFIIGYASALHLIAKHCLDEGVEMVKPKAVLSTSSKLLPSWRQTIEKAFCCDVYDVYGSREMSTVASECPQHSGLHVASEHVILEFIKDGESVGPGETGKVLITNLHNYAMPFIRYDIGDFGKPSRECCPCGRGLPLIESIDGRTYEVLATSDGSFTTLRDLDTLFENLPVKEFQVIQDSSDEIRVKVVRDKGYTQEHARFIAKNLKLAGKARTTVETVDSIPLRSSGKKGCLVSMIETGLTPPN